MTDGHQSVLRDFVDRVAAATRETPLTVFVCGPAIFTGNGGRSRRRGARLRAFISMKIAERGSAVFWAEHRKFRSAGKGVEMRKFTDADRELHFAEKSADLVVIFPDSAGSLAELGGFSMHQNIAPKLVVIFDQKRRSDKGYVVKAVARAAKQRKAQITFRDYSRPAEVWKFMEGVLLKCQTIKLTARSYASL